MLPVSTIYGEIRLEFLQGFQVGFCLVWKTITSAVQYRCGGLNYALSGRQACHPSDNGVAYPLPAILMNWILFICAAAQKGHMHRGKRWFRHVWWRMGPNMTGSSGLINSTILQLPRISWAAHPNIWNQFDISIF